MDFNKRGDKFATCSADCSAHIYSTNTTGLLHKLQGHEGSVTRVLFNPQGDQVLTSGMDGVGRIWDSESGQNIGLLQGHSE